MRRFRKELRDWSRMLPEACVNAFRVSCSLVIVMNEDLWIGSMRRYLGCRKLRIGELGTFDMFATGVCVGLALLFSALGLSFGYDTAWFLLSSMPIIIKPTHSSTGQKLILLHNRLHLRLSFIFRIFYFLYYLTHRLFSNR